MYFWRRSWKLTSALSNIALSIWATSTWIASFNPPVYGACACTHEPWVILTRNNHKWTNQGTRWGKECQQTWKWGGSPKWGPRTSIDALAVWAIAPSWLNHTRQIGTRFSCNSNTKKIVNHLYVVLKVHSISIIIFKKIRINDSSFTNTTPDNHFWVMQWFWMQFSRIFKSPIMTFLLIQHAIEMCCIVVRKRYTM